MLKLIFPFFCLGCQAPISKFGLCDLCQAALPYRQNYCQTCGLALAKTAPRCGNCQKMPENIQKIYSVFHYQPPISLWLQRFKFQGDLAYGRLLAELLAQALSAETPSAALLPVPLHAKRLAERGFNQSLELSRPLAKSWQKPVLRFAVQRQRPTESQVGLSKSAREKNLKNAFRAKILAYENLAIIDDVFTTGSTLFSLAKSLEKQLIRLKIITLCRQD